VELKRTGTVRELINALNFYRNEDGLHDLEITKHKKRRSLNANNYFWAMVGAIANNLGQNKEEIHLMLLKRYGVSEMIAVKEGIDVNMFAKYCEKSGNRNGWDYWKLYKGSSEMNTKEMAILLEGTIDEARLLGIETLDNESIKSMEEEWK